MEPLLVIGGFVVIVGAIAAVSFYMEKKRSDALQAVAGSLGFAFTRKAEDGLFTPPGGMHLFSQGHSRKAYNIMSGQAQGIDVTIFDYRFTTGSGKSSHTWQQTVILFRSSRLQLPSFTLRPEGIFDKIGSVFGGQDIDFPARQVFSSKYLLRSADEDAVRTVFSDDLLNHYEQHAGLSTEADGDTLAFYRSSKRMPPEGIRAFLAEGFGVFSFASA